MLLASFMASIIYLVVHDTEEYIATEFFVKLRFSVVRNSDLFSMKNGRTDLPRMNTSACKLEAQVSPMKKKDVIKAVFSNDVFKSRLDCLHGEEKNPFFGLFI